MMMIAGQIVYHIFKMVGDVSKTFNDQIHSLSLLLYDSSRKSDELKEISILEKHTFF